MTAPIIIGVLALLLQCWDWIVKPRVVHCPPGWYIEGIRPDGDTECRPSPPPNCGEPTGEYQQPCPDDVRVLPRHADCDGDAIVLDERSGGCP